MGLLIELACLVLMTSLARGDIVHGTNDTLCVVQTDGSVSSIVEVETQINQETRLVFNGVDQVDETCDVEVTAKDNDITQISVGIFTNKQGVFRRTYLFDRVNMIVKFANTGNSSPITINDFPHYWLDGDVKIEKTANILTMSDHYCQYEINFGNLDDGVLDVHVPEWYRHGQSSGPCLEGDDYEYDPESGY